MRDEPDFPEGASLWTRIGLAADWLGGRMNAGRIEAGSKYETSPYGEGASFRDHELQPRLQHGKGGIAFVGGLADEQISKAVYEAYLAYVAKGRPAAYFTESQGTALAKWLDDNAGNVTSVWAHSYGVPAAAEQFSRGHGEGVPFYSVDGVGRFPVDLDAVRRTSGHWVNINSTSNATRNDAIAKAGRRWDDDPASHATHHFSMPYDHVDIWNKVAPRASDHRRDAPAR